MTRWSMSGLLARVGKSLLTRRPRSPQPIRRARLQIEPLEERIVLDAVAPGSWWDDGV
jgi:hypothetical protein